MPIALPGRAAPGVAVDLSTGPALAESDPLRTALGETKASGKGLTFYVNGAGIPGVEVSVAEEHVVAKSRDKGKIVIRLDSIDAVAGFVGEKKP